jgi:tRNA G37 N-methylase TrmD
MALEKTRRNRPDLINATALSEEDRTLLREIDEQRIVQRK